MEDLLQRFRSAGSTLCPYKGMRLTSHAFGQGMRSVKPWREAPSLNRHYRVILGYVRLSDEHRIARSAFAMTEVVMNAAALPLYPLRRLAKVNLHDHGDIEGELHSNYLRYQATIIVL